MSKQTARIEKLENFVRKFLGNFEDCDDCDGTGRLSHTRIECASCHATGKRISSIGVLYVELPDEAAELLKETS